MSEQSYVVAGARFYCNRGTHYRRLDLPMCHGVYIRDKAATNEDDCVPFRNIPPFGVCLSSWNSGGEQLQTSQTEDMLPFGNVTLPIIGGRCTPSFMTKWLDSKEDSLVDGKAAVTINCTLVCRSGGGVISFVDDGQGAD